MPAGIEIVGLGEVLMDIFEDGTATLGGAPLNVAVHSHQLLAACGVGEGVVVSAIGNDDWGNHARSVLESFNMSTRHISVMAKPTGTSLVFERQEEAEVEICNDVAWDFLSTSPETSKLAARCSAVTFGSLAQRCGGSRKMIQEFVASVDGIRLYDVNLRCNTVSHEAGYSKSIIEESCKLANFVKMNINELRIIASLFDLEIVGETTEESTWSVMEKLLGRFALQGVVVTRGRNGSLFVGPHQKLTMPPHDLRGDVVHPVGAGDAFSAGMLFGLSQEWPVLACLQLAEKMGAWIVQHISATPPLSIEILAFVRSKNGYSNG